MNDLQKVKENNSGMLLQKALLTQAINFCTTSSELEIILAGQGLRIGQMDWQIKEHKVQFFALMAEWIQKMGRKEIIEAPEAKILFEFMHKNYGRFTVEDVRHAVDLAITAKLNVDPELYGQEFAPMYISKILNAYSEYSRPIYNAVLTRRSIAAAQQTIIEPPEVQAQRMREILIKAYRRWHEDKIIYDYGDVIFKWLALHGYTKAELVKSEKAKEWAIAFDTKNWADTTIWSLEEKTQNKEVRLAKYQNLFVIHNGFANMKKKIKSVEMYLAELPIEDLINK